MLVFPRCAQLKYNDGYEPNDRHDHHRASYVHRKHLWPENQQAMNKRIDDLRSYLDVRFSAQDTRFAAIEQRLDRIKRQLEVIFKPSLPSR